MNTMQLNFILSLLLTLAINVSARSIPYDRHRPSKSWAGVNSFFLHAFQEYEPHSPSARELDDTSDTDSEPQSRPLRSP